MHLSGVSRSSASLGYSGRRFLVTAVGSGRVATALRSVRPSVLSSFQHGGGSTFSGTSLLRPLSSSSSSGPGSPWWWDENAGVATKAATTSSALDSGASNSVDDAAAADAIVSATGAFQSSFKGSLNDLLCLSLDRRPFFPGMVFSFVVADPVMVEALKRVHRSSNPHVAMFLTDPNKKSSVVESSSSSSSSSSGGDTLTEEAQLNDKSSPSPVPSNASTANVVAVHGTSEDGSLHVDPSVLYDVGTLAEVTEVHGRSMMVMQDQGLRQGGGEQTDSYGNRLKQVPMMTVVVKAKERVQLKTVNSLGPPVLVEVDLIQDDLPFKEQVTVDAMSRLIKDSLTSVVSKSTSQWSPHFLNMLQRLEGARLGDYAAGFLSGEPEALQSILAEKNVKQRMEDTLVMLRKEEHVAKVQAEINERLMMRFQGKNKQALLLEQMRMIQEELGGRSKNGSGGGGGGNSGGLNGGSSNSQPANPVELIENRVAAYQHHEADVGPDGQSTDPEDILLRKIQDSHATMPERVRRAIDTELARFRTLDPVGNSSEYNVSRLYLDWLTTIPWNQFSTDKLDIQRALGVLDREHYGMKDVKERILEFISVAALTGNPQGKILCLVGPPGTGKTSIGQSIAHALGRNFHRISVGGQYDVSEIKGHRRTYVASMPGKITHCLKNAGVMNPVIMIDEVDKIGHGPQGDMRSALLEVLDPSQNHSFNDVYLDVSLDLSQVLFVCTANEISDIPGPLQDRMEVIDLAGYDTKEKVQIAKEFLIPKAKIASGFASAVAEAQEEADQAADAAAEEDTDDAVEVDDGEDANAPTETTKTIRRRDANVSMVGLSSPSSSSSSSSSSSTSPVVVGGPGFTHAPLLHASSGSKSQSFTSSSSSSSTSTGAGQLHQQVAAVSFGGADLGGSTITSAAAAVVPAAASSASTGSKVEHVRVPASFADKVVISDEAIEYLAKNYSREPGMRNFNNYIERIFRKLAYSYLDLLQKGELDANVAKFNVQVEDLRGLIGPPRHETETVFEEESPGLVFGLAAGPAGGVVLAIETSAIRKAKAIKKNVTPVVNEDGDSNGDEDKPAERSSGSAGGLFTTGLMRESMKESTEIAYINARHTLQEMDPGNTFFEDNQVHLHVPTGNPKDGPSAGITMTSALLSLALNKAVPLTTSMTGEITLGGYVLAVGGIKDKLLAARRQGITRLILPKLCKDTFEELAPHLKEDIEVHFVDKYSQVYDIVFGAK